uniref:Trafficking protein particle complex subunit 9 n=1 Tax=Phallusia mammillata TaxID=59560 RepID=A0A6F9DVN2_9ASCI|nr:trafficking protein particle complex subunit 9 [Phallusia mammillata]
MSIVDFSAAPHHHAEILICIQVAGNLQAQQLENALSKIRKHTRLTIADAGRVVYFRFQVDASPENSKWGIFQPHRKSMGFIMLAGCSTAMDVALMHQKFQKNKEVFAEYIFDSRCFVFGIDNAMLQQNKAEVYQYSDVEAWKTCDRDIKDFLTSVFYVLESKRVHIASDKSDRPPLLTAPFEANQSSNSDSDSRSFRKKTFGRWKKHLADISLLAGLYLEALQNYRIAIDALGFVNDQVWLGCALEGLCVVSAIVLYPQGTEIPQISFEKHEDVQKQTLDPKNLLSWNLTGAPSTMELSKFCVNGTEDFIEKYKDGVICYTRCQDMAVVEVEACIKATKVLSTLRKPLKAAEFIQNAIYIGLNITHAERITKYDCMANLYTKINFHRKSSFYKRIAAMQCVAPNLEQPDWFGCNLLLQGTLLGSKLDLTNDRGVPDDSLTPYYGWPQIQLRILHELIFASRRIGDNQMANRYTVYLLMKMNKHLTDAEIKEYCLSLETSANKISQEKETELLQLQDGTILPSLHLYTLPIVSSVSPQRLAEHLRPYKLNSSKISTSVFLFSPFSQQTDDTTHNIDFQWTVNTLSETCLKITNPLSVHNLRLTGLKLICEMKSTEEKVGKLFECHSVAVDVPAQASIDVSLVVVPYTHGCIHITGYEFVLFGIKSRCLFSLMPWLKVNEFEIEVAPELPLLQKTPSSSKENLEVDLYPGEKKTVEVQLSNLSDITIDTINVTSTVTMPTVMTSFLSTRSRPRLDDSTFGFKCRDINLPLLPRQRDVLVVELIAKFENYEDSNVITNQPDARYEGHVKLRYTGIEGRNINWCREEKFVVSASLHPGLFVEKLEVLPSNKQGQCWVSITLINFSQQSVVISSKRDGNIENEASEQIVDRDEQVQLQFHIPALNIKSSKASLEKYKSWNVAPSSECVNNLQTQLSELLDLKWKIPESQRSGTIDLSTCSLSRDSVVNLIKPPLLWEVFFNDGDVTETGHCDVVISEPYTLTVKITNKSDCCIPSLDADLELFQDQLNGFREWNMEDCLLCLSSQSQNFQQVEPGSVVEFECILVFLLAGVYHVRLHRAPSNLCDVGHVMRTSSGNEQCENFHNFSPKLIVSARVR